VYLRSQQGACAIYRLTTVSLRVGAFIAFDKQINDTSPYSLPNSENVRHWNSIPYMFCHLSCMNSVRFGGKLFSHAYKLLFALRTVIIIPLFNRLAPCMQQVSREHCCRYWQFSFAHRSWSHGAIYDAINFRPSVMWLLLSIFNCE
jgi:hypothetical protein